MKLSNGNEKHENGMTLGRLIKQELKVSFPRKKMCDELAERWGIAYSNVLHRLYADKLPNFVSDIKWLYEKYGIGFDMKKGFFYDEEKARIIELNEEMEDAALFGMSK
ncbi:MAG TPA: hypothetical protein VGN64_17020 [Dyadobacter sp.]|jgi:hypothetical protein|nr:hypothetical protein [Dyadobacter sp.]